MYLKQGDFKQELNLPAGDERLIRYLKGETLEIAEEEACFSGWTLVLNDGYPLGFGKLNKGTLKNKYCSGWSFYEQMRLDKWLADAGAGTRSQVKEYLKKGRIRVNGETVKKPETKISEETE